MFNGDQSFNSGCRVIATELGQPPSRVVRVEGIGSHLGCTLNRGCIGVVGPREWRRVNLFREPRELWRHTLWRKTLTVFGTVINQPPGGGVTTWGWLRVRVRRRTGGRMARGFR